MSRRLGVRSLLAGFLWLVLLGWSSAGLAAAPAPGAAVGEVTFVIGVARRFDAAGEAIVVARGMQVNVADRIETEAGGHVHLRFVDGAFVAIRPESRLRIDEYRFDRANPHNSAVRFTLEQGVVRSITGEAGKLAKDRFRLNTPIAAIGVRGTDFVVLADRDTVRATVNSGAIVLAPLGQGCVAESFGPCATGAALGLSADMGQTMVEYQRRATAPRLIAIGRDLIGPDQAVPPAPQEPRDSVRGAASETQASTLVASASAAAPKPAPAPVPEPVPPPAPPPPAPPPPAPPPSLIWGRYVQTPLPEDTMTAAYATASAGREITVGDTYYGLFRTPGSSPTVAPGLGLVDFTLKGGQARFTDTAGAVSAAKVDGGWLRVDFDASHFWTGLQMSGPVGGSTILNADGVVRDDGVFTSRTSAGIVAGATSLDGKEAGYLFERYVPKGTYSGITLWGR